MSPDAPELSSTTRQRQRTWADVLVCRALRRRPHLKHSCQQTIVHRAPLKVSLPFFWFWDFGKKLRCFFEQDPDEKIPIKTGPKPPTKFLSQCPRHRDSVFGVLTATNRPGWTSHHNPTPSGSLDPPDPRVRMWQIPICWATLDSFESTRCVDEKVQWAIWLSVQLQRVLCVIRVVGVMHNVRYCITFCRTFSTMTAKLPERQRVTVTLPVAESSFHCTGLIYVWGQQCTKDTRLRWTCWFGMKRIGETDLRSSESTLITGVNVLSVLGLRAISIPQFNGKHSLQQRRTGQAQFHTNLRCSTCLFLSDKGWTGAWFVLAIQLCSDDCTEYGTIPGQLLRFAGEGCWVLWPGSKPLIISQKFHRRFHTSHLMKWNASYVTRTAMDSMEKDDCVTWRASISGAQGSFCATAHWPSSWISNLILEQPSEVGYCMDFRKGQLISLHNTRLFDWATLQWMQDINVCGQRHNSHSNAKTDKRSRRSPAWIVIINLHMALATKYLTKKSTTSICYASMCFPRGHVLPTCFHVYISSNNINMSSCAIHRCIPDWLMSSLIPGSFCRFVSLHKRVTKECGRSRTFLWIENIVHQ